MDAIILRDKAWATTDRIPNWIRGREVGLDQFNTLPTVAKYCWNSFRNFLRKDKVSLSRYRILEPSAGTGSFYDLLPKANRIGIDVEKYRDDYIQHDFLTWDFGSLSTPFVAIGNPPFGYRGWLALAFLNRAAEFCDYVGFILPMSFQSEGKGSPKNRVNGMRLVHSERLPDEIFLSPNGEQIQVNTLWQIWKKGSASHHLDLSLSKELIELFTVDTRKERLCGVNKMVDCNLFLQRTYYGNPPKLVDKFDKVKYGCGYGIIIKKDKRKVFNILCGINWDKYSNLAVHNCRHISMYHIQQALLDYY